MMISSPIIPPIFSPFQGVGSIYAKVLKNLKSRGDTLWLPGVGVINGFVAGNYLDNAGTIFAAVDGVVGLAVDSISGVNASQATSANKPLLTKRVNLLVDTEDFSAAGWIKNNCTCVANIDGVADLLIPSAASSNYKTAQSANISWEVGRRILVSVKAKAAGYGFAAIVITGNNGRATFNLETGTATCWSGINALAQMGGADDDGYRTITFSADAVAVGSVWIGASASMADPAISATADGISGVLFKCADARIGIAGRYQYVNTAADYDMGGFPYLFRFDSTDVLTATFPAGYEAATIIDAASGGQITLINQNIVGAYNMGPSIATYGRIICKSAPTSDVLSLYQNFCNKLTG